MIFLLGLLSKFPVTERGFEAICALSKDQIPVMASGVVQPTQALVASLSGAGWVLLTFHAS